MFYPLGRKSGAEGREAEAENMGRRGVGGYPPPRLLYVRGLNGPPKKPALIIVGKTACQKVN